MQYEISNRMSDVHGSAIRELFKLTSRPGVISFGGGNHVPLAADAPPPEPANDRPWEQAPDWTPKEKFWAVMGVLKATLAIAGVYLVGLGVLLAVLFLLWK